MAGITRDRSGDPAVRTLAYDVETSQQEQIGRMQAFLSLWDAAPFPTRKHMTWMRGTMSMGGMDHGGGAGVAVMPGMASAEDLARLRQTSEAEFDVLFLQLLVRHHQGGAAMLRDAAARAELPQVRNLAARMLEAQRAETEAMIIMLAEWGAAPLAPPA